MLYGLAVFLASASANRLWLLLFLNVAAGIVIISQASDMTQEVTGASATASAALVSIISIANASGRFCGPGSPISSGASGCS